MGLPMLRVEPEPLPLLPFFSLLFAESNLSLFFTRAFCTLLNSYSLI